MLRLANQLNPLNRTDPAATAAQRERSRSTGRLWAEVLDVECEHCDKPFVPPPNAPDTLLCRRCRRSEGDAR